MARPIVMPGMSMYAAEGTVAEWLKPRGTMVEAGEPILAMTTDKAAYEIEAPVAGILHPIAPEGVSLPVEAILGYILAPGEDPPALPVESAQPGPASEECSTASPISIIQASADTAPPLIANRPSTEVRASPRARRLAVEHGIDLDCVVASGPGGRIIEADVLAAVSRRNGKARGGAPQDSRRIRRRLPLAAMRQTIAERMRHSLSTAASLTLTREVAADTLVSARAGLAEKMNKNLSYDALFVKLFASALRERPELNSTIENDAIFIFDEVHVGFAVAVPGGLVVPVVRNADLEPLASIAGTVEDLSHLARSGKLRSTDVEGATATITNLGAYGIDAFTPIINPPQSTILGIGRITSRPVVRDSQLMVGRSCVLSLTFDHRVTDGVPAAQLLDDLARLMNDEQYLASWA